jgi:hypothetical protein
VELAAPHTPNSTAAEPAETWGPVTSTGMTLE